MAKVKEKVVEAVETLRIGGTLYSWTSPNPGTKPREYTVLNMPYSLFQKLFYIKPFTDNDGEGWQRIQAKRHIKDLHTAIRTDNFTPACFYGGIHKSHEENLEKIEENGVSRVILNVSSSHRLPTTDGGHRDAALKMDLEAAHKSGQQVEIDRILALPITVFLLLDHTKVVGDFLNYQKGKAMDRNTQKSMLIHHKMFSKEQMPFHTMADKIAHILDKKDSGSHLSQRISFVNNDGGLLNYSSLAIDSSSNLGCSLFGTAKIGIYFKKNAEWMASTQLEAFEALENYTEKEDDLPIIFQPNRFLTPKYHVKEGGSKGAVAFIIGIGNLLAWRKVYKGQDKATEEDMNRIAEIADEYYQRDSIGWSGDDKRRELGDFARLYFADMIEAGDVEDVLGIPIPLTEVLTPSTFKISKAVVKARKLEAEKVEPPTPLFDPEASIADEFEGKTKPKPKPKAKKAKVGV